jgi:hypothetical protein
MYRTKPADPAALADASTDADDIEEDKCGAWGPHNGECCRDRGHKDGAWDQRLHVTYDNDHYQPWPVGWRPLGHWAKAVVTEYRLIESMDVTTAEQRHDLSVAILRLARALK